MYLWDKSMCKELPPPWLEEQFPHMDFTFVVFEKFGQYLRDNRVEPAGAGGHVQRGGPAQDVCRQRCAEL